MIEFRCKNLDKGKECNKLLAKLSGVNTVGEIEIKCPRCGSYQHYKPKPNIKQSVT